MLLKKDENIPEYMYPKYDFVFKRLFGYEGNEDITKDLVSNIIDEKIKKLEFKNPFMLREVRNDKEEVLDIKAVLDNDVLCDVEIQIGNEHDFDKRILDYWAKMYRTSIGKKARYKDMKRTIVIFIAVFNIDGFEKIKEYKTRWKILEEKLKIPLTNIFELDIIELSKAEKCIEGKNELENWLKFLINPKIVEELKMGNISEEMKKAYEIWQDIQQDEETRDAAERRYLELGSIEEAQKIEYELGKKEGIKEIAKKMLAKGVDKKEISVLTGLTREEIDKISNPDGDQ